MPAAPNRCRTPRLHFRSRSQISTRCRSARRHEAHDLAHEHLIGMGRGSEYVDAARGDINYEGVISRPQACKRRDHCGRRNAAIRSSRFLAQSTFERVEVELVIRNDALSDGARLD